MVGEALSFDEIDPDLWHGHDVIVPTTTGYVGYCCCGWTSGECKKRRLARGQVISHIARTPAGRRLRSTLRRG